MDPERETRPRVDTCVLWSLVGLLSVAGWGCTNVQQGGSLHTALMETTGSKASAADLRAVCSVLAISIPGTIQLAADQIGAQSLDAAAKRRALLWKIEVIPAFYQALFYSDPLAAALDAWSLAIQLEQAASSPMGAKELGSLQPVAIAATHKIRMQIETAARAAARTTEGFERAKGMVERWAMDHPIVDRISSRPSILPELTRMAAGGLDISVFQVVANLPASVADLATRMDIYAAYLPEAARWQAELLAYDFEDRAEVQRVLATFASVERLTERTNALLSPASIKAALDTATRQIRDERIAALASVDQQRVETLAYLTRERVAAVADIDRQRIALVRQLEELREKGISDMDELTVRIIHRGTLAVALLFVLAACLALALLLFASRMRARTTQTSSGSV